MTSAPTVVARGGGEDTLVVCGRGTDDALYCNEQVSPGVFGGWQLVAPMWVTSVAVAVPSTGASVSVFFRASTNFQTFQRADQPGPGQAWTVTDMGGAFTSAPVVARDSFGYRTLFGRGTDYAVWYKEESANGWSPNWTGLGGTAVGMAGSSSVAVDVDGASAAPTPEVGVMP